MAKTGLINKLQNSEQYRQLDQDYQSHKNRSGDSPVYCPHFLLSYYYWWDVS